jgi:phenylacetic acid degradation operon negative regulatory protein
VAFRAFSNLTRLCVIGKKIRVRMANLCGDLMAPSSPYAPTTVTTALVNRFRRQRPLRGGSLVITVFGDSIAPRGGEIALASLIRIAAPFGLTERLVRTSVGRLAAKGWLEGRRYGRLGYYRLSATGAARFAEATRRIYGDAPDEWDGHWTLILAAPGLGRSLHQELRWLGFGLVLPGVLAHPSHAPQSASQRLRELGVLDEVSVMRAATLRGRSSQALVERGWDLADLARGYRRFIEMFKPLPTAPGLLKRTTPPSSFVIRTLLIHEYRKVLLRDPLLPKALLPADWPGGVAHRLCSDLYRPLFASAEEYLSRCVATSQGPLPAASADALSRFGGLRRAVRTPATR